MMAIPPIPPGTISLGATKTLYEIAISMAPIINWKYLFTIDFLLIVSNILNLFGEENKFIVITPYYYIL